MDDIAIECSTHHLRTEPHAQPAVAIHWAGKAVLRAQAQAQDTACGVFELLINISTVYLHVHHAFRYCELPLSKYCY